MRRYSEGWTRNPARNPNLRILNTKPGPEKFLDPEPSPEPGFPGRVEKPGKTRKFFRYFLQSIVRYVTVPKRSGFSFGARNPEPHPEPGPKPGNWNFGPGKNPARCQSLVVNNYCWKTSPDTGPGLNINGIEQFDWAHLLLRNGNGRNDSTQLKNSFPMAAGPIHCHDFLRENNTRRIN